MRVTGNEWDLFAIRDNLTVFDHSASGRICDAIRENFTFFYHSAPGRSLKNCLNLVI